METHKRTGGQLEFGTELVEIGIGESGNVCVSLWCVQPVIAFFSWLRFIYNFRRFALTSQRLSGQLKLWTPRVKNKTVTRTLTYTAELPNNSLFFSYALNASTEHESPY